MKRLAVLFLIAGTLPAANWKWIRRGANIASCAASMVDARTTLQPGLREANPLLGQGPSVVGIKIGVCAGTFIMGEMLSKNKHSDKALSVAGFAATGMYTGFAIHNSKIPR